MHTSGMMCIIEDVNVPQEQDINTFQDITPEEEQKVHDQNVGQGGFKIHCLTKFRLELSVLFK